MASNILTMLFPIFLVCWFFWLLKSRNKPKVPLPPGPAGLPLVGYLPFLDINLHRKFAELAEVYGPIFKLRLGSQLCVVVSSPGLVKEVVRDHDITFGDRQPPIAGSIITYGPSDIILSPYGSLWRKLRKTLVREMLSKPCLDACYFLRKQAVVKSISNVSARIGTPIDIGALMFTTVVNATLSMLLGNILKDEEFDFTEIRKMMSELVGLVGEPNISDFFPMLAWFDLQGIARKSRDANSRCDQLLDSAIHQYKTLAKREGKRNDNRRKDLMQYLLEHEGDEDTEECLTPTEVKGLLLDTIFGGADTSSSISEWAFVELLRHPEKMKKVQDELAEVIGMENAVEEFHFPKLCYLEAVVKETFRLHPVVPLLLPRYPSQSCIVGGFTIPKGSKIFVNTWAMHRDPSLWDSPLEFRPERFLNDSNKFDFTGNNFQFLPFGSGRRICAGLPLAEKLLMFVLASFLHSFEWKLPHGAESGDIDLSEKFGLVMKKKIPLLAIPTPRSAK